MPADKHQKTNATRKVSCNQYCTAPNCNNCRAKRPTLSFFRFPREKERSEIWVRNCRRLDLKDKDVQVLYRNYVFCAEHFEDSQFMNAKLKNKLIWNAIPTLFDVSDPPPSIAEEKARNLSSVPPETPKSNISDDESSSNILAALTTRVLMNGSKGCKDLESSDVRCQPDDVQTTDVKLNVAKKPLKLSSVVLTPQQLYRIRTKQLINRQRVRLWRLKKQVQQLKAKVRSNDNVEDIIKNASNYISGVPLSFFANQMRMASKKNNGKRWTTEDKMFALSLNDTSVEAYRLCSRVFSLPSVRTLQRWLKAFRKDGNFHEDFLKTYKENLLKSNGELINDEDDQVNILQESPDMDSVSTMETQNATFIQTLVPVNEHLCLDGNTFRAVTSASLPIISDPALENLTTEDQTLTATVAAAFMNQVPVAAKRQAKTRKQISASRTRNCLEDRQMLDQHIEFFASLDSDNQTDQQHINVELQTQEMIQPTLQLLSSDNDSNTITAVQEVNPEGAVILTPIIKTMPITLADDTVNYEIVTLDMSNETLTALGLN